jgi:hypothetical protein
VGTVVATVVAMVVGAVVGIVVLPVGGTLTRFVGVALAALAT